jgi:hypothetical protein
MDKIQNKIIDYVYQKFIVPLDIDIYQTERDDIIKQLGNIEKDWEIDLTEFLENLLENVKNQSKDNS